MKLCVCLDSRGIFGKVQEDCNLEWLRIAKENQPPSLESSFTTTHWSMEFLMTQVNIGAYPRSLFY